MSMPSDLHIVDGRTFGLFAYRHGHSYALIRGFPEIASNGTGDIGPVLDLCFELVWRVSCWKNFSPLELRYATRSERDLIQQRIGPLRPLQRLYLLEPGTVESYVVASRLILAEYRIGGGAVSPLVSDDPDYIAAHRPASSRRTY
jgi:hypothetical protein